MLKIGEFSQLGQVTVRTLRHYDELGLLKPAHIDPASEYRYYTLEQLPTLHRIVAWKEMGLPLGTIGALLVEPAPVEQMRRLLQERQSAITHQIAEEQQRLARIAARLRMIEEEGGVSPYEVALKEVPAQTIATIRQTVPHITQMKDYRCEELDFIYSWLRGAGIEGSGTELAIYHTVDYHEDDIDMEVGYGIPAHFASLMAGSSSSSSSPSSLLPPDPIQIHQLPAAEEMATVVHRGDMWGVVDALMALYRWTYANGRVCAGPYRELHPHWRENEWVDFGDVVVELQLPTEATAH
jgi:DNA-binding transcriptional MerR regulator